MAEIDYNKEKCWIIQEKRPIQVQVVKTQRGDWRLLITGMSMLYETFDLLTTTILPDRMYGMSYDYIDGKAEITLTQEGITEMLFLHSDKVEFNFDEKLYHVQYCPSKLKLWVHCSTGDTVGRFDTRFGMDIHNTLEDQMNGASQCLKCTHSRPERKDFEEFCHKAKALWNVDIDQSQIKM